MNETDIIPCASHVLKFNTNDKNQPYWHHTNRILCKPGNNIEHVRFSADKFNNVNFNDSINPSDDDSKDFQERPQSIA